MNKLFLACALSVLGFSTVLASEVPPEESTVFALYAETENGAAEVVIYSNFYTLTIDENEVLEEIYESIQVDTAEAEAEFTVEESQFALNEEDQWWVEAGLDEANQLVKAGLELHFYVESEDPDVLLQAALDRLEEITFEDLQEHYSYYVKENSDSSIYGVVIISDLFGEDGVFSDVEESAWYAQAIAFVYENEIVEGYSDGTYRPENEINRAEFTKILIESRYPGEATVGDDCFDDVSSDQWYATYVCFAKDEGIIAGYPDGTFKPAQSVNLAEALKITLETYFTDISPASGPWYEKYWLYAEENGYLLDEWDDASEYLTRGAMAELVYRILD